jgi:hypothetical protein
MGGGRRSADWKLRHRGREQGDWIFTFTMAVYDLVRIRTLIRVGVCPA